MAVRRLDPQQPEDFAFTPDNLSWAESTIGNYPPGKQASAVIPLLWRAQEQAGGWLPEPAVRYVGDMLDMPEIRVLEVATFYTMFQLSPVGTKAHVQVCGTTPCMLRGSDDLIAVCKRRINEQPHALSGDGAFSWEEVECLGACVNAPLVQVGRETFEDLDAGALERVLDAYARGEKPTPGPQIERHYAAPVGGATTLKGAQQAPLAGPHGSAGANGSTAAPAAAAQAVAQPVALAQAAEASGDGAGDDQREQRAGRSEAGKPADEIVDAPTSERVSGVAHAGAHTDPAGAKPQAPTTDAAAQDASRDEQASPTTAGGETEHARAPADPRDDEARAAEQADIDAKLARLDKDATPEERANAVGSRPRGLVNARGGEADDLKRIKGIGPVNETRLNELGIYHFDQIAGWERPQVRWVGVYLAFPGRIDREDWVGQARVLASGQETSFSRRVDAGEVASSKD
ncbi:MAG: NADH-quinone oxidoreductase subunit NuoE [Pseudomonadota bacterium]